MSDNEIVMRKFIAAWSGLNVDELVRFFTDDGTYHNMMAKPVTGRDNLHKFIGGFVKGWTATEWEILNVLSRVDIVVAERVDRTSLGDRKVELPCVGVFEMQDGKIRVWRDYFDLQTYTKAIAYAKRQRNDPTHR